ncbi:hypothetical protein N7G274_005450 [Stereocaulon virgatum]|uniref:Phosphomannose isomerase type I catalytic domain-containing protein n=1 Tax=Stereocaulon virgatum TaxID=373712 RepID=A0ABR4A8C5_9LECA
MGDYPVLPAKSLKSGVELHKIVDENKEQLLGQKCIEKFGGVIPFLLKILSIAKALPLQLHPNKDLASKLHKENPKQFTYDNHKPEIAIAWGHFEVFAGWMPTSEIQALFDSLPPLQKFLPNKQAKCDNETLRSVVETKLKPSDESIKECQRELREIPRENYGKHTYVLDILPRLQDQYSIEDPANLVVLLYVPGTPPPLFSTMNFLTLPASSAIHVPADCPHAYLSGTIAERIARSNNVLNTGFCPRASRTNISLFTSAH